MSNLPVAIQFLSFAVKESYFSFHEIADYKIKIDFETKALVKPSVQKYILSLETQITEANGLMNIRVLSESVFDYDGQIDLEVLKGGVFTLNAPAIVFPYIRAYIASLTAISGVPTLNLPTLNLTVLGDRLKENILIED